MAEPEVVSTEVAREAKEELKKKQQELMDELTECDHINRFFKEKCFAFADEAEQTAAISSLINCEDKFVEAYMVTVGKVYQESRKRVFRHYKNVWTMYLFLTAEEGLMDTDGHRINSLVTFVGNMYNSLLKLRSDALTLCEAIRQIKTSNFFPLHKSASFHRVWRHIAEIMYQFATVDYLAELYPNVGKNFGDFQKKIKSHFNSEFTAEQRKAYDAGAKAQEDAQSMILKGNCFRTLYESSAGDMDNNMNFAAEMKDAISELLASWEKGSNQGIPNGRFFCGIAALTVYYYHHFPSYADVSLVRKVVTASKKIPSYRIMGEEVFVPIEFLRRQISNKQIFDTKLETTIAKMVSDANTLSKEKVAEMVEEVKEYCGHAATWMKEFMEKKRDQTASISKLSQWGLDVSELFLKCIRILETITRDLYLIIRSKRADPQNRRVEIDRSSAYGILKAIETVKKLEMFVMDNWQTVEEGSFLARQQWRKHMLRILGEARKAYVGSRSIRSISQIEASTKRSFYHIAEAQCVNEMIPSRNVVLGLAYEIGRLESHVSNTDRKQVHDLMSRLETFNSPRQLLQKAAYTGLLLSHSWLPHMYFESLIHRKPLLEDINGFTNALGGMMEGAKETGQRVKLMTKLTETIQSTVIDKIGSQVDVDLRVLANPDLAVGAVEKIAEEDLEYIGYLLRNVQKFQVATIVVPIKENLQKWLESHWYAMEILTPNNAKMYTRMMEIAKTKYGLSLQDPDLPQADIDETVGIMDLLQNLSHFAANYCYFSQGYLFVEKCSDSKRLHVIRLDDLKTALCKHGVGILPTAVNAAYQLIRSKLQSLLAFLSMDVVRNQIQKYLNEMEATMSTDDSTTRNERRKKPHYRVAWASAVLKSLARTEQGLPHPSGGAAASVTSDGTTSVKEELNLTVIDKYRGIVTQIGNAISLVRMLCQAARENGLTSQELFPAIKKHMDDLESTTRGLIYSRRDKPINNVKVQATYRLGLVKDMFERVSGGGRNYTKLLCTEFKSLLLKSQSPADRIHPINYFHGVIPALSLSYVYYMVSHENRVKKSFSLKHNKDLVVVDDGFAAGIAFLLHVMDGWDEYFKLNWFDAFVAVKENELRTTSENRQFSQAVQLRLERVQTELKILNQFKMNFGVQHTIFTLN